MILQEDIMETLPITANQMQMILDSQEKYRKRLFSEFVELHREWCKKYKWYDWNYSDQKEDFEKRNYLRWYWLKHSDDPIHKLEYLVSTEKNNLKQFELSLLQEPTFNSIKSFSYKFIYATYYLIILKMDWEWLSSIYVTLYAKECTIEIKEKQAELDKMKSEHYSKYWNWWQKLINQ